MFLRRIDLTTALRPSLLPDETLLFVQEAVGLYEGKFKLPKYQNGQAYLTSHRVCYVDNEEPRSYSVAIDLKEVDRYEFYVGVLLRTLGLDPAAFAGFLKSSPKITFHRKVAKRGSLRIVSGDNSPSRGLYPPSPASSTNATWICPICSFSNPVPSNFDPSTSSSHAPLPPCLACGIEPPYAHVLKAAISIASNRPSAGAISQPLLESHLSSDISQAQLANSEASFPCPRCTFHNHPFLLACELCGAPLISANIPASLLQEADIHRSESPGPLLSNPGQASNDLGEPIKFSFRAGGDKIFHERLKGAMVQRKWLLQGAPPIPKPMRPTDSADPSYPGSPHSSSELPPEIYQRKTVGIAGLEQRGLAQRKNNELVLGNAFEDLAALMASAKEIVALAESFSQRMPSAEASRLLSQSATALGMVTTKDMLGPSSGSESLYISELSRTLAEFLTDDTTGILRREGGIMSLVDLWAMFNRARSGVELVSPADFKKAAQRWDTLRLPLRLRQFRSGLLVVQAREWTDDKTVASLLAWLAELHSEPAPAGATWDVARFGRGVTAQEAAERFGWSVGVASEELEMAEERGALCREVGVEGLRFWENWILRAEEVTAGNTEKAQRLF
ncbi:MAG: hypothetical protein M1829_001446 [Trizodia sp. TS-e1964]|nr:MAG: hypothetical protein M1829_001446 [Trizodia sp. TS-e1964]